MTVQDERFEDRLLRELRAHVEARRDAAEAPAGRPGRVAGDGGDGGGARRRVPRLALAGGGLTVAAVALALATGGSGTPDAFAVEPQDDGSVTVEIRSLTDADGLERALRAEGVNAEVEYLPEGKACKPGRYSEPATPAASVMGQSSQVQRGGEATRFTVRPVAEGQTLVITTSTGPAGANSVGLAVAQGAVGPCETVPATTPARPPSGAAAGEAQRAPVPAQAPGEAPSDTGPSLVERDG